jgi:hypothetical protein
MNHKQPNRKCHDELLEIILRHWPHMPEYARIAMSDSAKSYGPSSKNNGFPTPKDCEWTDVEIVLIDEKTACITIWEITRTYTFEELGLISERRPYGLKNEGKMLKTYAENTDPEAYSRLPYRPNLKVHISKFRTWLQGFFGIPGDPLHSFESKQWMPRFKIRADYL